MASRKKPENTLAAPPPGAALTRWLSGELLIGMALLLLLFTGAYYGWRKWGVPVTQQPEFQLTAASIEIPPTPPWIRADIKSETLRDGSLTHVSIFDKDLSVRVYRAFEMHPWIEQVNCVRKRPPARVIVDLDYRRPVAWVEVPAGVLPNNEVGVVPVDGSGVLLPTVDFTDDQLDDYPKIAIAQLTPYGLAGTPWGDPRVTGCAQIAALLSDDASHLDLHRIIATTVPGHRNQDTWQVFLTTRRGWRFIWGNLPGQEAAGEATAAQKKLALRQIAALLEKPGAAQTEIDLRDPQAALAATRTANRSTGPQR